MNQTIVQGSGIGPVLCLIYASDLTPKFPLSIIIKYADDTVAPSEGQGGISFPPMGGRPKVMQYVCAFIVMELLRITRQIHCKAVEQSHVDTQTIQAVSGHSAGRNGHREQCVTCPAVLLL